MARPNRIPYEDVAAFVQAWPSATGYAPALAERYGIPVRTAHRWISETRRRGALPPGDSIRRRCPTCGGTGEVVTRWGGS